MTAGRRNTLVEFQTYTTTQDGAGEEDRTWTTVASEWAAVFYGRGDERRQAAMEQGAQPANFQVLSNSVTRSITITARIIFDDANWNIVAVAPDAPERGLIEFTAIRAA
jgi:head-tail adaptor